jgi:hypothetical protein
MRHRESAYLVQSAQESAQESAQKSPMQAHESWEYLEGQDEIDFARAHFPNANCFSNVANRLALKNVQDSVNVHGL